MLSLVSAGWLLQAMRAAKMRAERGRTTSGQKQNANQQLYYNQSQIQQFFLAGGELGLKYYYKELAVLLLVIYLLVLIGNSMICTVVLLQTKLHTPMYFFISNLSVADIIITTSVLPKMISVCLLNDTRISLPGCFWQQNTYLTFQTIEGLLLGVMAFDRYVAICNPLRYNDLITPRTCALLLACSVAIGLLPSSYCVLLASQLSYCGDQVMFWFCDFPPVIALSCSDTTWLLFLALMSACFVIFVPLITIVLTYFQIILSVCKIKSVDGRKKAFSTCSSHLCVVFLFYTAHLCVYISSTVNNVHPNVIILISIFNCFLTPIANPIIYSFRNKDLKIAIGKQFRINSIMI